MRTHLCGELREADIGSTVSVCGWVGRRREHGEHLAFVDLRDHSGIVQCVINDDDSRRDALVPLPRLLPPLALAPPPPNPPQSAPPA